MNYAGKQIRNYSNFFVQTGHETQMHWVEKSIYSLYHKFSKKIINKSWSPSLIFLLIKDCKELTNFSSINAKKCFEIFQESLSHWVP
mgnify:CR=1 FL=1